MDLIRSCLMAFAMYTRIPVPQVVWKEENMRHVMSFFPLTGGAVGLTLGLWLWLSSALGLSELMTALWGTAIPVLVTGGIHLDGFLDTMDGIHSYGSREKKLEILKDPHVGAFAVIFTAVYLLMYAGALAQWIQVSGAAFFPVAVLVTERAFSGLAVVTFPSAKQEGLAASFAKASEKKQDRAALLLWLAGTPAAVFLIAGPVWGAMSLLTVIVQGIVFLWFKGWSKRVFGGITGDLAGFYLQVSELLSWIAASAAIAALGR